MATLPTLNPNGAVVNTTNQWTVGSYLDIDEAIASADANEVGDDSNATITETGRYLLANMPTDFGSMDTVAANVRYRVIGAQTSSRNLSVQIVTDEATPVALTNAVSVATGITTTARTNSGALTLTIQGTPTKAQWDNAVVALILDITKVKGGDTNGIRVDAVDVTGTYTAAASTFTGTVAVTLADATSAAAGTFAPAAAVPDAITTLQAVGNNTSITTSWRAPADNGSAITNYEYRLNGGTWTSMGQDNLGFTITGLTNTVSYDVEVRAVNAGGNAATSNLVAATPTLVTLPAANFAPPDNWNLYTEYALPLGGGGVTLNDNLDYRLTQTGPLTESVTVIGGRNVVWMGGEVRIDVDVSDDEADMSAVRFYESADAQARIDNDGRIIHVEGLLAHGTYASGDIQANCPEAIVQIVNCRVEHGKDGLGGVHPDVIQLWGGVKELRVDGLTGLSTYQGLQINEDLDVVGDTYLRRTNIRRQDSQTVEAFTVDTGNYPRYLIWTSRTTTGTSIFIETGELFLDNPYRPLGAATEMIWPEDFSTGTDGTGDYAFWALSRPDVTVADTAGTSPGRIYDKLVADYVPASLLSTNYTTPGYVGAAAPGTITTLAGSPSNGSAVLTWTAPASNKSIITDYEYRINGGTWTSTGSDTPGHTVTGLTNGVSYNFEVRAVNGVGSGAASNLVSVTPANVFTFVGITKNYSATAGTSNPITVTATAGNLIVGAISIDKQSGTITGPTGTGWAQVFNSNNTSNSYGVWWKIADGDTSDNFNPTWATSTAGSDAHVGEWVPATGTVSVADSATSYSETIDTGKTVDLGSAAEAGLLVAWVNIDSDKASFSYTGVTEHDNETTLHQSGNSQSVGAFGSIAIVASDPQSVTSLWGAADQNGLSLAKFAVAPTFTGTSAVTLAAATSAAAGTFTNPTLTGSSAVTLVDATSAASGTHTAPTFTGTSAATLADATSTAAGTHTAPTFTGTSAVTLAAATSAASGTHTAPSFTGTASVTLADATSAASGTFTVPTYTGTSAVTLADATSAAAGTFTNPTLTGSSAVTLADATSAASGTHTAPTVTGTVAVTLADATSTATGTHTAPTFSGTSAVTLADSTSAASGTFTPGPVSGSAAVTLADSTSAASGTHVAPTFTGSSSTTLDDATSTATGTHTAPTFTGTTSTTLDDSTSAASGTFTGTGIAGNAAVTLADATSAASGTFTPSTLTGSSSTTLDDATSSAAGTHTPPSFTGSLSTTLADSTSAAAGTFTVPTYTGTTSTTLDDATAAGSGTYTPGPITGTLSTTLADATSAGNGNIGGLDADTYIAALYREHSIATTYRERAIADTYRERAFATTYKAGA